MVLIELLIWLPINVTFALLVVLLLLVLLMLLNIFIVDRRERVPRRRDAAGQS